MRAVLTIICWVVAINLGFVCSDGGHGIRYLLKGDGLLWGYFCMAMMGTAIPLFLALLVGLLGRRLGLRRTWWTILSGMACGVIVIVGCIAFGKLDGGGIALTGLFLLAGGSVGFTVRPRDMTETKGPDIKRRRWLWIAAACVFVAFAVAVMFPDIVRPLGMDPSVFEDIQWMFRRALGQTDTRPFDL